MLKPVRILKHHVKKPRHLLQKVFILPNIQRIQLPGIQVYLLQIVQGRVGSSQGLNIILTIMS